MRVSENMSLRDKILNVLHKHLKKYSYTATSISKTEPEIKKFEHQTKRRLLEQMESFLLDEIQSVTGRCIDDGVVTTVAYFYYIPSDAIGKIVNEILKMVGDR